MQQLNTISRHIVIPLSSLFLGFLNLIQIGISLCFSFWSAVSWQNFGSHALSMTLKSSTYFLILGFYHGERNLLSRYINEKSNYTKGYLQLHKSDNYQHRVCSENTSAGQKSASLSPLSERTNITSKRQC